MSSVPFKVITDHMALRSAFQKRDIHGRLALWLGFLAKYDFEIVYRAGKENGGAEYLSRIVHRAKVDIHDDEVHFGCLAPETLQFGVLEPDYANIAL